MARLEILEIMDKLQDAVLISIESHCIDAQAELNSQLCRVVRGVPHPLKPMMEPITVLRRNSSTKMDKIG